MVTRCRVAACHFRLESVPVRLSLWLEQPQQPTTGRSRPRRCDAIATRASWRCIGSTRCAGRSCCSRTSHRPNPWKAGRKARIGSVDSRNAKLLSFWDRNWDQLVGCGEHCLLPTQEIQHLRWTWDPEISGFPPGTEPPLNHLRSTSFNHLILAVQTRAAAAATSLLDGFRDSRLCIPKSSIHSRSLAVLLRAHHLILRPGMSRLQVSSPT